MKVKDITDKIQQGVELLKGEEAINKTYCSQNSYRDEPTAQRAFARARERIFDVNRWSEISSLTADFSLLDPIGNPKPMGRPDVGDHIRVQLPGPAPENWVKVIEVEDEDTKAGFTARPCSDPREKTGAIEHFFTDASTSTFRVSLVGQTVFACQIGENERVNNQPPEAGDRAVINTMVAGAGWLFYQKIQWKTLTDYLVDL
ncbi:hypothetical protein [Larkinella rosea]|uniref:Uncharacterized protein n=1 Tax=Larkinella rosea TaxID=2025312 RepID=A0A3P1BI99_9BACT|nr:hypothetical protein [Larkinella rosea]RRB00820.1 hypothetical protein EHT25_21745 [Larkinella rosea]